MEKINSKDDNLYEMLEKLLFNEEDLNKLKVAIDNLSIGQISPKNFRTQLIENRVKILEKLLQFFPFYHKQETVDQSLKEFTGNNDERVQLSKELKEKDDLLEEIGLKINHIFEKLKEKQGAYG